MPTTRPRYTVTDTGGVREMLDLAHRRYPAIDPRAFQGKVEEFFDRG